MNDSRENEDVSDGERFDNNSVQVCGCGWRGPEAALINLVAEDQVQSVIDDEVEPQLVCPRCGLDNFLDSFTPRRPSVPADDRIFQVAARFFNSRGGCSTTWECQVEREDDLTGHPTLDEYERQAALERTFARRTVIDITNSADDENDDEILGIYEKRIEAAEKAHELRWRLGALRARERAFKCEELSIVLPFLRRQGYFGFDISAKFGRFVGVPSSLSTLVRPSTGHSAEFRVPGIGRIFVVGYHNVAQPAPGEYSINESGKYAIGATCRGCLWTGDRSEALTVLPDEHSWHQPGAVLIFCPKCALPLVELIGDSEETQSK